MMSVMYIFLIYLSKHTHTDYQLHYTITDPHKGSCTLLILVTHYHKLHGGPKTQIYLHIICIMYSSSQSTQRKKCSTECSWGSGKWW